MTEKIEKLFEELMAEIEKLPLCTEASNAEAQVMDAKRNVEKVFQEKKIFIHNGEVLGYYDGDVIAITDPETIRENTRE